MEHLKANPLQQLLEIARNADRVLVSEWNRNQNSRSRIVLQVFLDHVGNEEWVVVIVD